MSSALYLQDHSMLPTSRMMAVPLVTAGRPDMDSSNPAYADNAARCDREAVIYQV